MSGMAPCCLAHAVPSVWGDSRLVWGEGLARLKPSGFRFSVCTLRALSLGASQILSCGGRRLCMEGGTLPRPFAWSQSPRLSGGPPVGGPRWCRDPGRSLPLSLFSLGPSRARDTRRAPGRGWLGPICMH